MKTAIKKALSFFGYHLSKKNDRGWNSNYLRSLSNANIIIDIGAANGTPILYHAFQERRFILFEPLIEFQSTLEVWRKKINCEIVYIALGNVIGKTRITIDPRRKTMSSITERSDLTTTNEYSEKRVVKISKLDSRLASSRG